MYGKIAEEPEKNFQEFAYFAWWVPGKKKKKKKSDIVTIALVSQRELSNPIS